MSNKNPRIQATKHFSMPNKFVFVIVFLVPTLFRLRDSTHPRFMPIVASVLQEVWPMKSIDQIFC